MTGTIATLGNADALALAGSGAQSGEYTVRFGAEGPDADVVWLDLAAERPVDGSRVIAQDGPGLWRRSPWPASDDLFDLHQPARATVLVVGEGPVADEVVGYLDDAARAPRLTRPALEDAGIVLFAQEEGAPLPAPAFAVLAARRVLVVREPPVRFGLEPGVNHLAAETVAGTTELATSAVLHWDAFDALRAFGRVSAEPYRASTVYSRLAFDLAGETDG